MFYYFDKLSTENVASIEVVSFTSLHKLPRYLTKSMSLNDFARSKGLGSYELSIGVLDKRTQKAEVFAVRTQEQWDIWAKEIDSQSNVWLQGTL